MMTIFHKTVLFPMANVVFGVCLCIAQVCSEWRRSRPPAISSMWVTGSCSVTRGSRVSRRPTSVLRWVKREERGGCRVVIYITHLQLCHQHFRCMNCTASKILHRPHHIILIYLATMGCVAFCRNRWILLSCSHASFDNSVIRGI